MISESYELISSARIHSDVEDFLRHVIESKAHPEQAYESCRGILSFVSRICHDRLMRACRWPASSGLYNYNAVDTILRSRHDILDEDFPVEDHGDITAHARILQHPRKEILKIAHIKTDNSYGNESTDLGSHVRNEDTKYKPHFIPLNNSSRLNRL